jgi:hypothetical protein
MSADRADRRVVTAAELEAMTPQERHAHSRDSIVWDLDTLPAWYRDKLQASAQATIARRDAQQTVEGGKRAS